MSNEDTSLVVINGISLITDEQISNALVIPGFYEHRDSILAKAKASRVVFDDDTQKEADAAREELRKIRIGMEKALAARKAPITALAKQVQRVADTAIEDVVKEEARLKLAIEKHQAELRRKEADAQRKRDADALADRLAEEERQRVLQRRQAELDRQAAEAQKQKEDAERLEREAREANSPEALKRAQEAKEAAELAQQEAQRKQDEEEMRQLQEEEFKFGESSPVEIVPEVKLKGREVWDFEEMEIMAFARNYPDLVKMEIKRRDVLEAIANGTFDTPIAENQKLVSNENQLDQTTIRTAPGLRIFKTVKI